MLKNEQKKFKREQQKRSLKDIYLQKNTNTDTDVCYLGGHG